MRRICLSLIAISMLLASCSREQDYFISGSRQERTDLAELFQLLSRQKETGESRFVIVQKIAMVLLGQKSYAKLITFLTAQAQADLKDPYDSYYLFLTAYAYTLQGADPMAAAYFYRVIKNYPDLLVQGESVHLACLKKLISLEKDSVQRVSYYREILARFPDKIDMGSTLFMLGQAYEKLGEWDLAIQTYQRFMAYPETVIPGFPDAYQYARKQVDFSNSSKDWTFEDLDDLVTAIQSAIKAMDFYKLNKYRAKVNFFAMSWAQEETDENSQVEFDLTSFLGGAVIHYDEKLDSISNQREAYLKTWGWNYRVPILYFCFRKINFPANPDIHGHWEWSGIRFGERFK
jgi:tetratricopeptide (TPR) repeat protein